MEQRGEHLVIVERERVSVDREVTVGDLKDRFDVDPRERVLYWRGGTVFVAVPDDRRVVTFVPDGAPVVFSESTDEALKRFWREHGRQNPDFSHDDTLPNSYR